VFKVIEDYEEARALSEAGLLWYRATPLAIMGEKAWAPDSPGYWREHDKDMWKKERGKYIYAVLLEE